MWLLSVNILWISIGLIGALNKSEQLHLLPAQSITSHVHVTQSLNKPNLASQQLSQLEQVHKFGQRNNQLGAFGHVNQLNQFGQQIQNNHAGGSPQSQLAAKFGGGQLSQQQASKEISCADNQTINFLKYSNHKLSLNFLNKLTELTVGKLLNQSSTTKTADSSRYSLNNFSKPITQLCHEACRNEADCLAFTINTKQFTCYLLKEDYKANNRDRLLFDTTSSWNFYEKVCLNQAPKTAETCNQIWSFDIHPNGHLNNPSNSLQKQLSTGSLEECLNLCWTNDNGSLSFKCRSVNYDTRKTQCTLNQHNRRIIPEAYMTENQFTSSVDNLVYAENHCVPFQGKCVFRHLPAYYLPDHQIYDVEANVNSPADCEQLCTNQSLYVCRAFAYSKQSGLCKLSPEPSTSLINTITSNNRRVMNARRLEVLKPEKIHQQAAHQAPVQQLISQPNSFAYYERTSCINVKIDCDANGMHTNLLIDGPFSGRLFTANNFEKCSKSNSDSSLEQINMTIPLDANECGTVSAGNGTFSNRLILQYHPLILKESDRRIEVSCDYHLVKQKVRGSKRRVLEAGGLSASQVITGLAESPPVKLKILNEDKEEVRGAKLGETLFFKVEISDESVFGIFGSSLVAKSGNGNESLLLIDDHGCPLEPTIFPAVNVKSSDSSKSLSVPFQAFKFASDQSIKFHLTISFCLDSCAVITCDGLDLMKKRSLDLVLNRKRRSSDKEYKAGDIVTDVKMETNFFIISDDEKGTNSDTTLIADVKPSPPALVGTSLLVTKAKTGQRHSQMVGNAKAENSANYPQTEFSEKVCISPVLVYLFALLALLAQLLLMFFCTWILFNTLKRRSYRQSRVNSRTSSQLTSDLQSLYSLPTGNSTLTNYYTNSNLVDSSGELDCLGALAGLNTDDLGKLKWTKEAHLWPIKLNKSCTSSSKLCSPSSAATVFGRPTADDYFNSNDICIS